MFTIGQPRYTFVVALALTHLVLLSSSSSAQLSTESAPDLVGGASETTTSTEGSAVEKPRADVRLVISGGLSGLHDGLNAFFRSPLFRANRSVPLTITDATSTAFTSTEAVFFAESGSLDIERLIKAKAGVGPQTKQTILIGPSTMAIAPTSTPLGAAALAIIRRAMAGVTKTRNVVVATHAGARIFGVSLVNNRDVVWPTATTLLTPLPSARGRLTATDDVGKHIVLLSRRHASTPRTFGEIDRLLAQDRERSAYVDVGGSLTSGEDATEAAVSSMARLLAARDPKLMAMGRAELVALANARDAVVGKPYIVAADGIETPAHRTVVVDRTRVLFVALGGLGRQSQGLLPAAAKAHSTERTLEMTRALVAKEKPDVVVGIALSSAGERAALRSPLFDLVLHLTSSRVGALPTSDDVDVTGNHDAGSSASAVLVRISRSDVTEVRLWRAPGNGIARFHIGRTPVMGEGPEAPDALSAIDARNARRGWHAHEGEGLTARGALDDDVSAWNGKDLTRLLGSLIRERTGAELSIIAVLEDPLPVEGKVPMPLARAWLSVDGRLRRTQVKGDVLLSIFDKLSTGSLNGRFYVNGGSRSSKTVRERPVAPLEDYDIVYSPELAPALKEAGLTLADDRPDDSERLPLVGALVETAVFDGISKDMAQDALDHADGVPEHIFIGELADVALSTSVHRIQGNEAFGQVRDSRVLTPNYWGIGVNGRATLAYDGPLNYSAVVATSQFTRQEQEGDGLTIIQEARDTLLFEAESRLLLKRVFDTSARFTPEPGLRVSYQTEWTPNLAQDDNGEVIEQKRRAELRGFAGITLRPTPLFDEVRMGAIVENDFASDAAGALEWGGEAAVRGNYSFWKLKMTLESFVRGYVPDPVNDTPDDLMVVGQAIARVELPVVFGLRLGVFADAYFAMGKLAEVRGPTTSLILGASLSYGERIKFAPFR